MQISKYVESNSGWSVLRIECQKLYYYYYYNYYYYY